MMTIKLKYIFRSILIRIKGSSPESLMLFTILLIIFCDYFFFFKCLSPYQRLGSNVSFNAFYEKLVSFLRRALSNSVYRNSRWHMSFKIGILKNFEKFTGKYLCRSPF